MRCVSVVKPLGFSWVRYPNVVSVCSTLKNPKGLAALEVNL